MIVALALFVATSVGFIAGHVYTGWAAGLGPFAPKVHADPDQLMRMGRAIERHPAGGSRHLRAVR